jgi:hypothetical protein
MFSSLSSTPAVCIIYIMVMLSSLELFKNMKFQSFLSDPSLPVREDASKLLYCGVDPGRLSLIPEPDFSNPDRESQCRESGSAWIGIFWGSWIRIRIRNTDQEFKYF